MLSILRHPNQCWMLRGGSKGILHGAEWECQCHQRPSDSEAQRRPAMHMQHPQRSVMRQL